ncbi:MAG: 50S ribosomal protein L25 [Dehalococcoidia bacterium]
MVQATRVELTVVGREVLGKKVKRLRRQGLTPANIFGRQVESIAIQVPTVELVQVLRTAGRNEVVYLRLDGEKSELPTLIRHLQRDPTTDQILHVDFQRISLMEKVRLEVPIVLVGKAPAVETFGGTLLHSLGHITVEGLPAEIPSEVEVDVGSLETLESALHVADLALPPGLTVLTDPEVVVATVVPPKVEEEVVPVEEEEEEEAVPAEGEEAAAEEEAPAEAEEKGPAQEG